MNMKKYLAIGVILLFIGLAFAPSIHANISKEMVEFTTEVCGLDVGKQTVKLTQEEVEEVDALFRSIRERLNKTESREEAEQVFKEAVVELDKYGLLGGLSVKKAQRLVTGGYQNPIINRILDRIEDKSLLKMNDDENMFCLVSGETDGTLYFHRKGLVALLIMDIIISLDNIGLLTFLVNHIKNEFILEKMAFFIIFLDVRGLFYIVYSIFSPYSIGDMIYLGANYNPAEGYLFTNGLNGKKLWTGKFYGHLNYRRLRFDFYKETTIWYPGVRGFLGIKNFNINNGNCFYLGSAFKVKISENHP